MIRAAVTLVVASVLIAMGTNLKLPLSTTYVTFMVFMGASLADGAWGRESAVYRVSGVISVIGGWFFTALSAFTVAFVFANIFYFGGTIAIVAVLVLAGAIIYRTHKYHGQKMEEEVLFEKSLEDKVLTREEVLALSGRHYGQMTTSFNKLISQTLEGLAEEDLTRLNKVNKELKGARKNIALLKRQSNTALDQITDDQIETVHFYILVIDYLSEMTASVTNIVKPTLQHVDNNHKPLLPVQIEELKAIHRQLEEQMRETGEVFGNLDAGEAKRLHRKIQPLMEAIRKARKSQIKRIKNKEIGTRNSILYFNHLGELRNLGLFTSRIAKILDDLIISPKGETVAEKG
jgi:Na+/phosphate symporter